MDQLSYPCTDASLLGRLARDCSDPQAWEEFQARYGPLIFAWGRRWGLQEADAEDVKQAVLLKLLRLFETFRYDPAQSFRAWLKTVSQNTWRELAAKLKRTPVAAGSALEALLGSVEAPDELAAELERGYRQELLEAAMARVRLRVRPVTWEAFRLMSIEGHSGAEVAARLGVKLVNAYKARSNVRRLLQEEVAYLEGGHA